MTALAVAATLILGITAAALTDRSLSTSRLAKMAASSIVIALLVGGTEQWTGYAIGVGCALAASWIGDLALSYPGRGAFISGLVSFAAAHLAYVVAFVARGDWEPRWFAAGVVLMVVVGSLVLRWLRPHRPEQLAAPLLVYVIIIGAMVASAFATHGGNHDPRIPIAAVLFATSDILVARQQFVSPALTNRLIGLPMYFAAQLLFVLSAI